MRYQGLAMLLLMLALQAYPQSRLNDLATRASEELLGQLKAPQAVVATVSFINRSALTDQDAQTVYQLIAARLEQSGLVQYRDLMVNFSEGEGRFNLSEQQKLRYALFFALQNTPKGVALSGTIRLASGGELVGLVYQVITIDVEELWANKEVLETVSDSQLAMTKQTTYRIDNSIFTIMQDLSNPDAPQLLALTPDELIQWPSLQPNQSAGKRSPLTWPFPRYPSLQNEGRMILWQNGNEKLLLMGVNYCQNGMVLKATPEGYVQMGEIPFVPFSRVSLGGESYLSGFLYIPGTNLFTGKMLFLNAKEITLQGSEKRELGTKMVKPALDFLIKISDEGQINSLLYVSDDYRMMVLDASMNPLLPPEKTIVTGANMVLVDRRWLFTSGCETTNDTLLVYDILNGGLRPVGSQKMEGTIQAMAEGVMEQKPGVWVLRRVYNDRGLLTSWLDFWEKTGVEN